MRRALSSIAVFCGSNFGASPVYAKGAAALGKAMAAAGVTLVYGGTTKGLMGIVADAILDCSERGELILDGFAGSGTTTIAAEQTGRIARASPATWMSRSCAGRS